MQTEIALGLQASLRVGRLMDEHKAASEMVVCGAEGCGSHFGLRMFAPPLRPSDLVGGTSGFHDGPLIGAEHRIRPDPP